MAGPFTTEASAALNASSVSEEFEMGVEVAEASSPGCPFAEGAAFDPFRADQAGEPYPWLEVSRREVPVFYWPQHRLWCVTRYEDINAILRDPKTYSNRKVIRF